MPLDEWKKLVTAPVADVLKPRGFRKSGQTFSAARSEVTLLVNLQSSKGSNQAALIVTCNLGICVHRLADRPGANIWRAHWRERLGYLTLEPSDKWWTCSNDTEAREAGNEIAALLQNRGLPVMEGLAAPSALVALWASGCSPSLTDHQRLEYLSMLMDVRGAIAEPSSAADRVNGDGLPGR